MKNLSVRKKVLTGIVTATMAITISTTAFAVNNSAQSKKVIKTSVQTQNKLFRGKEFSTTDNLKTKLDALVKASTITQAQEDKIIVYMEQLQTVRKAEMEKVQAMTEAERKTYFEQNKQEKTNMFNVLVTNGTITQVQADAIAKTIHGRGAKGQKKPAMGKDMKTQLDSLVKAGTITQEEETKILSYINGKAAEKKAEMEKVKAMTEAERKAYFTDKIKEKTSMLQQLVTDGIITQEKADAIAKVMPMKSDKGFKGPRGQRNGKQKTQETTTTENKSL